VNYAPLYVLDERLESRPVDLSWWRSQIDARTVVMTMTAFKVAPIKPTISPDVLDKIDIRVGTIELVEDVEGSEKLVKLTVDFGDHKRSILVGMKQERENPKEIEGKQALFVVNLEPKKMMGQVSEGMLFDIGYADGIKPVLAVPENRVPSGARAG
jgi:methionine--tRNA ligase beta chain